MYVVRKSRSILEGEFALVERELQQLAADIKAPIEFDEPLSL